MAQYDLLLSIETSKRVDEGMARPSSRENWRPVLGYEGLYEVSSLGRVRSLDRVVVLRDEAGTVWQRRTYSGQVLRQQPHIAVYPQVKLSKNGRIVNRFVHVLVCEAFHGPRPDEMQAAHYDGDRNNARAENLRWATRAENEADKLRHYGGRRCAKPRRPTR